MTNILNFAWRIKGGGREGGTCEVLRPRHPLKIWNVHLRDYPEGCIHATCIPGTPDHVSDLIAINYLNSFYD